MSDNKSEKKIKGMIEYPCCPKEAVIVYETSRGSFSIKCPRCGKFVLFDADQMTAEICAPLKGAKDKFRRGERTAQRKMIDYSEAYEAFSSQPCLMVAEKSMPYLVNQKKIE
jgi:hypothetical protein